MVNIWMRQPDTLGISGIWVKFKLMKILLLIGKKKPLKNKLHAMKPNKSPGLDKYWNQ